MSPEVEGATVASRQRTSANFLTMSRSQIRKSARRIVSAPSIGFPFRGQAEFDCNTTAASSAFLTVTLTGAWDQSPRPPSPGNYDPSIAQHLAEDEVDAWNHAAPGSSLRQDLASRQQFFTRQSMLMHTGGSSVTWWGSNPRVTITKT